MMTVIQSILVIVCMYVVIAGLVTGRSVKMHMQHIIQRYGSNSDSQR